MLKDDDFSIEFEECEIRIGDNPISFVEETIKAFGTEPSESEIESNWLTDSGTEYRIEGFVIRSSRNEEDEDQISGIFLEDASYSTARGIKVGDSVSKVKKAYGNEPVQRGDMLIYRQNKPGGKNRTIIFQIDDGHVFSIALLFKSF